MDATIKQIFTKYKKIIALILIILLIIIFGGSAWRKQGAEQAMAASALYQEMLAAELKHDLTTVNAKGELLLQGYGRTPYPQLAALLLAKHAVANGDLGIAEEHLRWVLAQKKPNGPALHIATVRLARVLQQQNRLDEALQLLTNATDAYETIYEEMIGDLYVAKGDKLQAKTAYMKALSKAPAGVQTPLLQMKLMDLGLTADEIQGLAGEPHA